MATKKISELDNATTPLAGTELVEVVQSATSLKTTASELGPATIAALVAKIAEVARTDATQTFTGAQQTDITTLADAATIAVDAALSNAYKVTITADRILGNPTNAVAPMSWTVEVIQDGTGLHTLSFGANYVGPASSTGASPLDTSADTAGKTRLLSCYAISATKIVVVDLGEAV